MADLMLGPMLRYASRSEATVWLETDAPCEVEILGRRERTAHVEGHHYALVVIDGLEPGSAHQYEVHLDGERRWPPPDHQFPPSMIRTVSEEPRLRLVFGSCRVALPHDPPYTLTQDQDPRGLEIDALFALAHRMRRQPVDAWPHQLLMLGDQIYADEGSPRTREWIRSRRDTRKPPGEEAANFEEYTRLYRESWADPALRWLFSTVPSAMIFDDHEIHDDWNISAAWVDAIRDQPWWDERVTGGLMSYWLYQHLGNLSPRELERLDLWRRVRDAEDGGPLLREFARRADHQVEGTRWSYCRDLGETRLVVVDSRAGRVLGGQRRTTRDHPRAMLEDGEWAWLEQHATGDVDHLLIATSLPVFMLPALHYAEAWNERVCEGGWGTPLTGLGERVRRWRDLEHWPAFQYSFQKLERLLQAIASGERGRPPASIVLLSGDVHHAYLAEVAFHRGADARSHVYQAVCSPFRNSLPADARHFLRLCATPAARVTARLLARSAGVPDPQTRWRLPHGPWFDNQFATLLLDREHALLRIEKTVRGDEHPDLEAVFERALS